MIDVLRSETAPRSIAARRDKWESDVLEQLHHDFFGKCYLTEATVALSGFEVDHRHPRNCGGEVHDWTNLYPASEHANRHRPRSWPDGGLLHPDGRDGIETRLCQTLLTEVDDELVCQFLAVDPSDKPAVNTARELEILHTGGASESSRIAARDLRTAIERRLRVVLVAQGRVLAKRRELPAEHLERRAEEDAFRRKVSRRAPFTALIRSAVHPSLRDLFD